MFALLVLALWQIASSGLPSSSLPSPAEVAETGWQDRQLLLDNTWITLLEILLGLGAAVLIGVVLAGLIHSSKTVERALYPWLVVSQMIPVPAIAPIILIWTGFDLRPKIIVIALVSFFPIAVNAIDGLRATDPGKLRLLQTMGASRWQSYRLASIPSALPSLFSGLKVAVALSVIGAVFAEWVGSSEGLGHLILVFNNAGDTAAMFATVFLLSVIGIGLYALVLALERVLLPWHSAFRDRTGDDSSASGPPADGLRLG